MQERNIKIETENSILELVDDKIIRMGIHKDIISPTYTGVIADVKGIETLLKGEKGKILIVTDKFNKLDDDCKKVIEDTAEKYFVKQAFVTKNSATVLFLNLLLLVKSHSVESKLFTSELKALEWLRK